MAGTGAERSTPTGSPGDRTKAQTDAENTGQIIRRRGRFHGRGGGRRVALGGRTEKKMLIIDERSRNVYENKQKDDTFTEIKIDISTQLNDILCRGTHVLQKSSALLSRFARWERYPSLPFVEAPVTCRMPPGVACPVALAPRRERVSGREKVQVPFLFLTNDPQNAITQIELPNGQFYRTRRQTARYTCFQVCRKSQITNRKSQMPQWPDDSMTRFRASTNPLTVRGTPCILATRSGSNFIVRANPGSKPC
jgi:hypothetical protein